MRDILNGEATAPPATTVEIVGTFEHDGEPAMLVQVDGPDVLVNPTGQLTPVPPKPQ